MTRGYWTAPVFTAGSWKTVSQRKDQEVFFFPSSFHSPCIMAQHTHWQPCDWRFLYMQKTAWISSLLAWPKDIIPNRQKFSFHDPISLNRFPSAQVVARHPSCKISWGRSIGPRWTGSRQLTSQNSCRGTTRCWKHPDSAATWKLVVTSPEGKSQTVTLELPALRTDK